MTFPMPRSIAGMALAVALVSSPTAVQPALAQNIFAEDDIRRMVEGLRNGTYSVRYASEECQRGFGDDPAVQDLREVMSTFLEVPEDLAVAAFCDALAQAVKDGEVTADGMVLVSRNRRDAASALEVGSILRAVYFSHVVTTTASAEEGQPR
jgi:hypothetical protein